MLVEATPGDFAFLIEHAEPLPVEFSSLEIGHTTKVGTLVLNSEYDSAKAFREAGADAEILVFRNLSARYIEESIAALAAQIRSWQILMFPGGFGIGDEPDGSAKFIATTRTDAWSSWLRIYFETTTVQDLLLRAACNDRDIDFVFRLAGVSEAGCKKELLRLNLRP